MDTLSQLEAIERMALALGAGALFGLERERLRKPAGLRTYMLVCEGAALFMIASIMLGEQVAASGNTTYDPSRIGSTIVQGIGFLAGGAILVSGRQIHGMTTAAGIWVTAAVGLLIGCGFYTIAFVSTGATLSLLIVLGWVEARLGLQQPSADQAMDSGNDHSSSST